MYKRTVFPWIIVSAISGIFTNANAEIAVGDTFVLSAWYGDETGMSGGSTEATEVLNSILTKTADTTVYSFSIIKTKTGGFFEMGGTMRPLITSNSSKMVVLNKTPSNVTSCSARFKTGKWIIGQLSDFIFYPDLAKVAPYWSIPINSSDQSFLQSDYYTIRVSDTTGIKWVRDTTGDRVFIGKFINFKNKADTVGYFIPDSLRNTWCHNTPAWRATGGYYSGGNPFYVMNTDVSSMIYPLKKDTLTMGQGCYGNRIGDYRPQIKTSIKIGPVKNIAKNISTFSSSSIYYNLSGKRINMPNSNTPMVYFARTKGRLMKLIARE